MDIIDVLEKHKHHKNDVGSSEFQIICLTYRMKYMSDHLDVHKKDNHSKRGFLGCISRRRKLLDYVKKNNSKSYFELIADLGIRK